MMLKYRIQHSKLLHVCDKQKCVCMLEKTGLKTKGSAKSVQMHPLELIPCHLSAYCAQVFVRPNFRNVASEKKTLNLTHNLRLVV